MGTLSHIMLMYLMWMVTSLLVGYSYEQDLLGAAYPSAAPLVSQRQSRIPSQQVIVPGGFQPHQLYANHQFANLRGLDANGNGRLTPISIQNQQFSFVPRGDPFARSLLAGGNTRASPTSASLSGVKPTSSRSLSPNFVEIISPSPQRLVSSNRVIAGASGQTSASNQQPLSNNDRNSADVQYEYYDETDGDVLYQYGNDFNEPASPSQSSSAGNSRQTGQYFSEVSSSKPGKNGALQRNPIPTTASTSSKREPTRYAPASSVRPQQGGSTLASSKSVIPSGTASRLFRPNRPSAFSSSQGSALAQASRETSSSFIPLIDDNEEPEQGLALNGRSVQSTSHRGTNSLSGGRPLSTFLRSSTAAPPSPEANSSQQPSPSSTPEKPSVATSRVRSLYSRTQSKQNERNSSSSAGSSRRPAILRGNSGNSSTVNNSRLSATSRPPIIIRPRNLTRSRPNTKANKKEDPIASSSTYRPDPNLDQAGSSSSEKSSAPGNSLPSSEDYTVEYVEYPFNNDDNSSVVEYYEVSEETAQALLQRAKAKANQRKSFDHPLKTNKTSSSTSTSTSSRSSVANKTNSNSSNESATKVTVSVSSKSSYSSTSTTSTTSTTAPPTLVESSSSEENVSADRIDPSKEVVISVATTKSVSGKGKDVTLAPKQVATPTPRVTFSRATGSSFVSSSVQTSRSVGKAQRNGHDGRTSKTIHEKGESLKDNMPSGAETAPEYYEEEYTYPDNYPILNNDAGSLLREHDDEEQEAPQDHYNPNEYSHEISIPPSVITPTKSVILQSSDYASGVSPSSSSSIAAASNQFKESSEASVASGVAKPSSADEESYDDESGSHAPRKLPSKKGDIPLNHFETLVDDVSELEVDHPLRPVNQEDLSPPPDDEASYHPSAAHPSFPTLTTAPPATTTTFAPASTEKVKKDPASILSSIRFAEVSPNFLPPGFKLPSASSSPEIPVSSSEATTTTTTFGTTTTTTTTTEATPTQPNKALGIQFDEISVASLLPKGYKPRPSLPKATFAPPPASSTTEKPVEPSTTKTVDPLAAIKSIVQFKEITIPGLIPKDYTPPPSPETKEEAKEPSISPVLAGIRFETPPNLLPPGYKPPPSSPPSPVVPIKFETPTNLLPKGFKLPGGGAVDPITFEFPANLLPPGYKPTPSAPHVASPSSTEASATSSPSTTKKPGGLVFPTKAGGARITRPTTTEAPKGDTPEPPQVRIATGWPTRKTTAFTGWPTVPTTQPPPTSSTSTTTTTEAPTTTTMKTTTTTQPPKLSPSGTCPLGTCRMEASVRIVGGVKWIPELQDVNTDEYKHLETNIKLILDGAYRSSSLAPFYQRVEIEGFNRGSVIVDYFVLLDKIDREISTDSVRGQFHKSLLASADEQPFYDESDSPDQLVSNGRLRFGRYTIDPRYTDFKVVNITKDSGPLAQEPLIPQWGIAVIVIGLASLLFVIIFGVTVLVNRHKNSKKKNAVSLTQEMLSEFNKSHMGSGAGGLDNYGADDLYNMDDVWNDKQMDKTFDRKPTKRSQGSGKGSANYNIYDSWKTEWNGYYYNGNYYGDSGYAPSRRRSDYDTNF